MTHIVPFIASEVLVAIFHYRTSVQEIVSILNSIRNLHQNFILLLAIVPIFAHVLIYSLLAQRTLVRHIDKLKQHYSSIDLDWAALLIKMVVIVFLISLLVAIVQYIGLKDVFGILLLSLNVISVVFIARLILKAVSQPMFQTVSRVEIEDEPSYAELRKVGDIILREFSEKKLFVRPELTVKDLAKEINVPERTVSKAINKIMNRNFYNFVNNYRIQEACHIFDNDQDTKLTVLEVLYRVGFNSKSSFNAEFKKQTGLTPSEYRARNRNTG